MGISNFVSLKYFYSKSKLNIINFISAIASFVLVVAACSFFIVLSVFSGLKDFGLQYNRSFDPDLKVSYASGGFFDHPSVMRSMPIDISWQGRQAWAYSTIRE